MFGLRDFLMTTAMPALRRRAPWKCPNVVDKSGKTCKIHFNWFYWHVTEVIGAQLQQRWWSRLQWVHLQVFIASMRPRPGPCDHGGGKCKPSLHQHHLQIRAVKKSTKPAAAVCELNHSNTSDGFLTNAWMKPRIWEWKQVWKLPSSSHIDSNKKFFAIQKL